MDNLELRQTDTINHMSNYGEENSLLFKNWVKVKESFAALKATVGLLQEVGAQRTSAEEVKSAISKKKEAQRQILKESIRKVTSAARQFALESSDFINKFQTSSQTLNDKTMLETARAFAIDLPDEIDRLSDYGIAKNFVETLIADTEKFVEIANTHEAAQRKITGTNKQIDEEIKTALEHRRRLNTILPNVLADNPGKLVEWQRAQAIQKPAKPSKSSDKPEVKKEKKEE